MFGLFAAAPSPRPSSASFEDQDNIPAAADNAADNAAADAAPTPASAADPPPPRRTGAHPARRGLLRPPALLARAARGRSEQGLVRRVERAKADAD